MPFDNDKQPPPPQFLRRDEASVLDQWPRDDSPSLDELLLASGPAPRDTPAFSGSAYNSYSGADIRAVIALPSQGRQGPILKVLANLQTISYSVFREKAPVRALGHVGEKGRTRGGRTVAGSMVFTVFDRHVLFDVLRIKAGDEATNATSLSSLDLGHVLVDQLPLFDVIINFANEYGHRSQMAILGCDIHSEGQVMSIQDMLTENTVQYTAQHIALMTPGDLTSLYTQINKKGERTGASGFYETQNLIANQQNGFNRRSPAAELIRRSQI